MSGNQDEASRNQSAFDVDVSFRAFKTSPSIPLPAGGFDGSDVLACGPPSDVHAKLIDGDPLGVTALCIERMQSQVILWDPVRVLRAAMARIAHDAWFYRGDPALAKWLNRCLDKSFQLVFDTIQEEETRGIPSNGDLVPLAGIFESILSIERPLVHRAVLEFQALPLSTRRTFKALLLEGVSIEALARVRQVTVEEIEDEAAFAIECMTSLGQTSMPCPPTSNDEEVDQ